METPCPRCGHHKTESVRHGFLYGTLWNMGYHLRACSFCNRWRLFKRMDLSQPHPDDMTVEELQENFNRKIAESLQKEPSPAEVVDVAASPIPTPVEEVSRVEEVSGMEAEPVQASIGVAERAEEAEVEEETDDYQLCPRCGGTNFRRSRRRWWERLLNYPRMARCMKCDNRFPYPR